MMAARPLRTTTWSSANSTRIASGLVPRERVGAFLVPILFVGRFLQSGTLQGNDGFRTVPCLRTDHKFTAHLFDTFLHSNQTKSLVFILQVKTATVIQ